MRKYAFVANQIATWEKYGIAKGIISMLKNEIRSRCRDIKDWEEVHRFNGYELRETTVKFIIPTPATIREVLDYPTFEYNGKMWYIDMICFNDELQVHLMSFSRNENKERIWQNGYWHTVREGLNLNDTMVLYEYISDNISSLILLEKDEQDKYDSTGALGVGIF